MVRVYCRCNGGDYFVGRNCPFDGWSSPESEAIDGAARHLEAAGVAPSIAALRQAGLDEDALARAVVIDFGSEASVFDGLQPKAYVVGGRGRLLKDMDLNFK
jgi:hypothetical protein